MDYFSGMNGPESCKPLKVPNVEGEQLGNVMNVHSSGQPGIVDVDTLYSVLFQ